MAKKISVKKLREVKERILHDGSFLEKEAFDLKISKEDLIDQLIAMYEGGKKNTQLKAVLETSAKNSSRIPKEELEKYTFTVKTRKRKTTASNTEVNIPSFAPKLTATSESESESEPELTPTSAPESVSDLIDMLSEKKNTLEKEMPFKKEAFEKAHVIFQIREETLLESQQLLEKAQIAAEKAKIELEEAKMSLEQAKTALQESEFSMLELEEQIQVLKAKNIYLVGPWYTGTLPKYGTFFSTEAIDGIDVLNVQEVPEKYLPEATLDGVLLFDYVPDYKKARIFCGLIKQFKEENKEFTLLVNNTSLQQLIEMYT